MALPQLRKARSDEGFLQVRRIMGETKPFSVRVYLCAWACACTHAHMRTCACTFACVRDGWAVGMAVGSSQCGETAGATMFSVSCIVCSRVSCPGWRFYNASKGQKFSTVTRVYVCAHTAYTNNERRVADAGVGC